MAEATQALQTQQREIEPALGFGSTQGFEGLQRVATMFAKSDLVTPAFKGNVANCAIAIEMAMRMGAAPMMVIQNMYIVHGRPGWSAQFLIAAFNQCGRFSALKYRFTGEKNTANWGCIAYATELASGTAVEGPEVTMAMAKAEGWSTKAGSKWLTMPQLMLTYRAAAFLVRTTAPEIAMGLKTTDELDDMERDVTPRRTQRATVANMPSVAEPAEDPITDAEVVAEGEPVPTVAESIAVQIHAARSMDDLVSCAKSIAVGMETGKVAPQEKAALDDIYTAKRKDLLAPAKTATVAAA